PSPERYHRWGSDLSNRMSFQGWGTHRLEYGFTAQWEDIDTEPALAEDGSLADPTAYGRIGDRQEFGGFVNWQWQPHPTLQFEAGLRYTRAQTDDHKLVIPTGHEERLYDDDGNLLE